MKKQIWIVLLTLLMLFSGCSYLRDDTIPETEIVWNPIPEGVFLKSFTDESSGKTIDYHLYVPMNATENMPLVIFLHGIGAVGSPALNENNPMIENAQSIYGTEFPFLILAPTCNNTSWVSKEMPQLLKALIDHTIAENNSDQNKIIITGHSMGSSGVFRMVQLYGDYFSAAVPVSDPDVSLVEPENCLDVPIWAFAGSVEHPFNRDLYELIDEIKNLGGDAEYTELLDIKHGKTAYFAFSIDLYQWILEQ